MSRRIAPNDGHYYPYRNHAEVLELLVNDLEQGVEHVSFVSLVAAIGLNEATGGLPGSHSQFFTSLLMDIGRIRFGEEPGSPINSERIQDARGRIAYLKDHRKRYVRY